MDYTGTMIYTTITTKDAKDRFIQNRGLYTYTYIKHYNTLRQKYKIDILESAKEPYKVLKDLYKV